MKKIIFISSSLLLTTFIVHAVQPIDMQNIKSISYRAECVEATQPSPEISNDDLGKIVAVGTIDLTDKKDNVVSFVSGNSWFWADTEVGQNLEACQKYLKAHNNLRRTNFAIEQIELFENIYRIRNSIFKSATAEVCYRKTLALKSRSLAHYYHPITGEQPQEFIIDKSFVTCRGNGLEVIDPETVAPAIQTPIIPLDGVYSIAGNDCAFDLSYAPAQKKIYAQVFDQDPKSNITCEKVGKMLVFSQSKNDVNRYTGDSAELYILNETSLRNGNQLMRRK